MTAEESQFDAMGGRCNGRGPTSDRLCRTAFAGGDHDEQLHEAVIDPITAALYNENILVPNGGPKLDRRFTVAEFGELAFRGLYSKPFADSVDK